MNRSAGSLLTLNFFRQFWCKVPFCFGLAVLLLNFSIDTPDRLQFVSVDPYSLRNENEIESLLELYLEEFCKIDNAIIETEENNHNETQLPSTPSNQLTKNKLGFSSLLAQIQVKAPPLVPLFVRRKKQLGYSEPPLSLFEKPPQRRSAWAA
jgi:hypothetical protein